MCRENDSRSDTAVALHHLVRDFRHGHQRVRALDNLSTEILRGQAVALLGVNGAGKTTLSKILATLIYPSAGTASIFGYDVVKQSSEAARHVVPVFGGDLGLYPMLTGRENLRYFAATRGRSKKKMKSRDLDCALEEVGLGEAKNRRVEQYSKGMKQRLHLAIGLASEAPLIILDEPTSGLDPVEAARFRGKIRELIDQGRTVLLTSHNLADVEEVAQRVLFLDRGILRHDMPLVEFKSLAGYKYRIAATTRYPAISEKYQSEKNEDGTYTVRRLIEAGQMSDVARIVEDIKGCDILDLNISEPSLTEAFSAAAGA